MLSASGNEGCVLRGELLLTSNYDMHEWVCVPKSGQFGVFSGNSLLVLLFFVLYINCHVFSVIYTLSYLCANTFHIIFCRDIWNKICLLISSLLYLHNTENGQLCQHKVRNAFTEHFCHLFSNEQSALKSLYNGAKVHLARLFNTQDKNRSSIH